MEDFNQLFDDHLFNIDKADSKPLNLKKVKGEWFRYYLLI